MKISIFGSGGWGTAIALLLRENGHTVTLWSYSDAEAERLARERENPLLRGVVIPGDIHITPDIAEAAAGMELAVLATPSYAVSETAKKLKPLLTPDCVVVCASKGIEKDTARLFSDILRERLGENAKIASLSGPTHAEEVSRRIPTACVAASNDLSVAERVQDIFMNDNFRVYSSTDVVGVELGAALKNVIALCAGISDGLDFGDNTIAMLATRGLAEIAALVAARGGRKETVAGLAGLGDLIVTCTSRHSRNRRAGVLIGRGLSAREAMREIGAVVEGYYAAKAAKELSDETGVELPICREAYAVLYENKPPLDALRALMRRTKRSEWETGEENWVTN
ncbi:MAG: NAD(P)-dependent glycerol-3-phosphate dehydrogenase [Oscillospiraceae bacterium]|jgi:glycerol-3-phosphate dehydrogenase (NAD(P)+)|nr:NAD(P)-dependent glycerol-3-phosphate dehydrogenase [Oscillospiraceae bacterium]